MGFIEKISLNLSENLGDKLNKNKEEKEVLNYGIFVVIHTLMGLIATVLIGIITGMIIEIIIIFITSSWFKRYTGGVHATTPEKCLLISSILSLILSLFCKYKIFNININNIFIIGFFSIMTFYIIINKKCPVSSKNKPLKRENTRRKLRKKAFNLLNRYFILLIILYIIYNFICIDIIKTIIISCILGIILQMIVLTEIGENFIIILDSSLNIFNNK